MRLDLDTDIRYPSGERAGILRKVSLDENNQANYVVMATEGLISRNVIVPVNLLADDPGDVLTINATPEEVDAMPDYEENPIPVLFDGWQFNEDAAPGGDVFPGTIYEPIVPVVEYENLPSGSVGLSQGTEVSCLDGRYGIVDEVLVDEGGTAYGFVARSDAADEHDRVVPLTLVQQIDTNNVLLNCTLVDLPTYTEEIVDEQKEPEPS